MRRLYLLLVHTKVFPISTLQNQSFSHSIIVPRTVLILRYAHSPAESHTGTHQPLSTGDFSKPQLTYCKTIRGSSDPPPSLSPAPSTQRRLLEIRVGRLITIVFIVIIIIKRAWTAPVPFSKNCEYKQIRSRLAPVQYSCTLLHRYSMMLCTICIVQENLQSVQIRCPTEPTARQVWFTSQSSSSSH